tara:strand:- start:518 stop:868 length:351 start_codon:yes stop_codon:yes gene_type:complete
MSQKKKTKTNEIYQEQLNDIEKLGLFEAAKKFTKELNEFKKDGFSFAHSDVVQARLDVCEKCIDKIIEKNTKCPKCSCYLQKKTKFKYSHCPIGKWDRIKNETNYEYINKIKNKNK